MLCIINNVYSNQTLFSYLCRLLSLLLHLPLLLSSKLVLRVSHVLAELSGPLDSEQLLTYSCLQSASALAHALPPGSDIAILQSRMYVCHVKVVNFTVLIQVMMSVVLKVNRATRLDYNFSRALPRQIHGPTGSAVPVSIKCNMQPAQQGQLLGCLGRQILL